MFVKNRRIVIKRAVWVLFVVYLSWLIYFLFFCEGYGRHPSETYRYNLEPFSEIKRYIKYYDTIGIKLFMLNIVGNIVAFIPFGASLPIINKKYKGFISIFLLGVLFTLCIETTQLIMRVGSFDVDDMILNTTGVVIGYIICKIMKFIYNRG